ERDVAKPLWQRAGGETSPLLWGIEATAMSEPTQQLLRGVERLTGRKASTSKTVGRKSPLMEALAWLIDHAHTGPHDVDFAICSLAAAHLLPSLAGHLDSSMWWKALATLRRVAEESQHAAFDDQASADSLVAHQLLAGELSLTLAYLFSDMKPLHQLRKAGRESLSEGLVELTNGEGLVTGRVIDRLPQLMACWTRCRLLGELQDKKPWSGKADAQYRWVVRQMLRWTSPEGRPLLGDASCGHLYSADMIRHALLRGGDPSDAAAAQRIFGRKNLGRQIKGGSFEPPEASDHCEWAGLAVLRSGWRSDATVAAVRYRDAQMELEVASGERRLACGEITSVTLIDGVEASPAGEWEESCWMSDEDVDFIELSLPLAGGAQIDRQILLAKKDRFLWMCDYVVCPEGNAVQHIWRLPIDDAVDYRESDETREAFLSVKRRPATALLPVALPEWRVDPRSGELASRKGALELSVASAGNGVACPLFWDFQPQRSLLQLTWRQLTVAQALEIQPSHVAAGYRVQCGQQQWVFYRSLAPRRNRTLLGQNISSEFFAARFYGTTGEAETLIEIEG
ncbi:MAG: hypothetical protein KDA61_22080, partial [Planctomycetales bacterium]|nr:hypothetical protein [Planctomycetales bacterium]